MTLLSNKEYVVPMAQNHQPPLKFDINMKCLYPQLIRKSITDQWVVS